MNKAFNILNVITRFFGEVCPFAYVANASIPARQFAIHDFHAFEDRLVGWERGQFLSGHRIFVGDGNLDFVECAENIELAQLEAIVVVDCAGILQNNQI